MTEHTACNHLAAVALLGAVTAAAFAAETFSQAGISVFRPQGASRAETLAARRRHGK